MKIIFIDIDGVLNSPYDNSEHLSDMNVDKLDALELELVEPHLSSNKLPGELIL